MKKGYFFSILLIAVSLNISGQEIKVGQKCPDVEIKNVSNYTSTFMKFSDFKGKLIILDFWSTHCRGCVAAFAKTDSMQQKFRDRVQFILVSREDAKIHDNFFAIRKKIKRPQIPSITSDSMLTNFFPHKGVPHYVWIDASSNKVVAIPDYYNVTEKNIQKFIDTRISVLPEMVRSRTNEKEFMLLGKADTATLKSVKYYSYLMPAIDTVAHSTSYNKVNGSKIHNRITGNGASVLGLILPAFQENVKYQYLDNDIVWEVKDPFIYDWPKDKALIDEWKKEKSYFYDLLVPPARAGELYQIMRQDIERIFGLDIKLERRKIKCLVLTNTSLINKTTSKGTLKGVMVRKPPYDSLHCFWNLPFKVFLEQLKRLLRFTYKEMSPLHDATGYGGNIDICLTADLWEAKDMETLRKDLNKYGLDLVEKEWEHEVIVVRDRNE